MQCECINFGWINKSVLNWLWIIQLFRIPKIIKIPNALAFFNTTLLYPLKKLMQVR